MKDEQMPWYFYLAWFFAGAFLTNSIPHLAQGLSAHRFQTPFARRPGVGESSALVNMIWACGIVAAGRARCCMSASRLNCRRPGDYASPLARRIGDRLRLARIFPRCATAPRILKSP